MNSNNSRHLVYNAIQCPDGTILNSRSRHDFQRHVQEDGREYYVDGGLSYQRIGYSDMEYKNISVYSDDPIEDIREVFLWTRRLDENNEMLPEPEHLLLKEISNSHLDALIEWVSDGYPAFIYDIFVREKQYREENK